MTCSFIQCLGGRLARKEGVIRKLRKQDRVDEKSSHTRERGLSFSNHYFQHILGPAGTVGLWQGPTVTSGGCRFKHKSNQISLFKQGFLISYVHLVYP